jgi:hypothetical protein
LEFQDLAEFDKVGIDGDAFRRFGGHVGQERRFDQICRCEFPANVISGRRESGGRLLVFRSTPGLLLIWTVRCSSICLSIFVNGRWP